MFSLREFPFIAVSDSTPPPECGESIGPIEFVNKFYACKFPIENRDRLSPYICYLIEQYHLHSQFQTAIAQLQFIYLCLTQRHFHIRCRCLAFQNQSHTYYDHLYMLYVYVFKAFSDVNLAPNTSEQDWWIYYQFQPTNQPILASMAMTCFPMLYDSWSQLKLPRLQSRPKEFYNLKLVCSLGSDLMEGLQQILASQQLYVRMVLKSLKLPEGRGPYFVPNANSVPTKFSLDDFDFRGSHLEAAHICYRQDHDSNSSTVPTTMRRADCRDANFIACDFSSVELTGTDFSRACVLDARGLNLPMSNQVKPHVFPEQSTSYFFSKKPSCSIL